MNNATITRRYLHGSGIPLEPGTRLRPSPDGHIYATTDPRVAEGFAFRNAVYEWHKKLVEHGVARRGRPLPTRPAMAGWVLTVTATQPALVDPDFRLYPDQFVRFPGQAKIVVTHCQPGSITSWRDQTRIISPYSLNWDKRPIHYDNGNIRTIQRWKDMGYTDADFVGLGPWFPITQFCYVGNRLALFDEDVLLSSVTGGAKSVKLMPSSLGTNNAADAAYFWR